MNRREALIRLGSGAAGRLCLSGAGAPSGKVRTADLGGLAGWASRILAPAVDYLAHPEDIETGTYRRSIHALRQAGIRL